MRIPYLLLLAAVCAAAQAQTAEVSGRTDKPVKEVVFLKRVEPTKATADKHVPEAFPAAVAADGKSFSARLAEGRYDIRLRFEDGTVLEGVDLGKKNAPENAAPLTDADKAALADIIAHLKTFFDRTRIFLIDGWRGRDELGREGYAWVLVEQLRWTKTTYDKKAGEPFVIFRMDVWEFERMAGAWRKTKPFKVIYRLNVDVDEFVKYKWYFTTHLPQVDVKDVNVSLGELKVPDLDPAAARLGFPEKGGVPPSGVKTGDASDKAGA